MLTNDGTIAAEGVDTNENSYVTVNMAVNNLGTLLATNYSTLLLNGSVSNPGFLEVTGKGAIAANSVTGGFARLDGTGTVSSSGFTGGAVDTIELGVSNTAVSFGIGNTGVLELSAENGAPNAYSGYVTGFTLGDGIELVGIAFVSGDQVVFTPAAGLDSSGGVLTVENSNGSVVYANINLAGWDPNGGTQRYSNSNFIIAADTSHNNNIIITDPTVTMQQPGNTPACGRRRRHTGNRHAGFRQRDLHRLGRETGARSARNLHRRGVRLRAQNGIDLSQIAFGANTTLGYSANGSGPAGPCRSPMARTPRARAARQLHGVEASSPRPTATAARWSLRRRNPQTSSRN